MVVLVVIIGLIVLAYAYLAPWLIRRGHRFL
jgi:hypothetical protein